MKAPNDFLNRSNPFDFRAQKSLSSLDTKSITRAPVHLVAVQVLLPSAKHTLR